MPRIWTALLVLLAVLSARPVLGQDSTALEQAARWRFAVRGGARWCGGSDGPGQ